MNRIMVVTGVPGVGKNFLVGITKKRFTDDSIYFGDFGETLLQFCKDRLPVQNKDMLRELSQEEINPCIRACVEYIKAKSPAVISSHSVVRQQDSYAVNYEAEKILCPKTYVFVTAPPKSILIRRKIDKSRDRELQSVEEIRFHNDLVRDVINTYANCFGSKLVRLENREDNVRRNVDILYREILKI